LPSKAPKTHKLENLGIYPENIYNKYRGGKLRTVQMRDKSFLI
tara:strand:+ start:934 stop:1062 length:129 start_codon:yes stop_codon:yes gene_type:complete